MHSSETAAILENLAEGVVGVDGGGRIVSLNEAARNLLGLGDASWHGARLLEGVRNPALHEMVSAVLQEGRSQLRELRFYSPRERVVRVQGLPCVAASSDGARVVLVLQDVSERHRYEALRREFVANVSHELKSPLTSIRSLTETLLEGALEDEANNRRFVGLIEEDASRLSRLIDDLLTLSRLDSRALPLPRSRTPLAERVHTVLVRHERTVQEKRMRVQVSIAPELAISMDPDRLHQVLENLIDNALKYAPADTELCIHAQESPGQLQLCVEDQGPGIPEEARQRIFERFFRVDKDRSRELGGTGLGLSIVKRIVEEYQGRVWVENREAGGARFCISWPLPETPGDPSWEEPEPEEPHRPEDTGAALASLHEQLLGMAGQVEQTVARAVYSALRRDGELARAVLRDENRIDRSENLIEDLCLWLLAQPLHNPDELRPVVVALKINMELERIGDLAVSVARNALRLIRQPLLLDMDDIALLAERAQAMFKGSLDALVRRDPGKALEVCHRDDEVDTIHWQIYHTMLRVMVKDPASVERAVALLLMARALERIADHSTNIAENVVYLVSGRTIRHSARSSRPESS